LIPDLPLNNYRNRTSKGSNVKTPHDEAGMIAEAFFKEVAKACERIVTMDGDHPSISIKPTAYVIDGRTISVKTGRGEFPFWLGLNGHRIFFIVYMGEIDVTAAKDFYKFTFGGAHKMGWDVNVEPIADGVSIWCTFTSDPSKPLAFSNEADGRPAGSAASDQQDEAGITKEGLFWAADIAMMVQSWIRTSERGNLIRHDMDPAPL
jgi:hypothetical protein